MANRRKLPESDIIRRLFSRHQPHASYGVITRADGDVIPLTHCPVWPNCTGRPHKDQEVADAYGASLSAVRLAKAQAGMVKPQPRRVLPWSPIMRDHINQHPAAMLRFHFRQERGEALAPSHLAELVSWRATMDSSGMVVDYSLEQGFFYTPCQPGDEDYYRPPSDENPSTVRTVDTTKSVADSLRVLKKNQDEEARAARAKREGGAVREA